MMLDVAINPATNPVAATIAAIRDQIRPIYLTACKEAAGLEHAVSQTEFELFLESEEGQQLREAVESSAIHAAIVAYLETEAKRRSEWERGVEARLTPVEPIPDTERNT